VLYMLSSKNSNFDFALDPYVVLPAAGGATGGHGFSMQPARNGFTGFVQPVRLAVCSSLDMLMHRRLMLFSLFRWLIHVSTLCDP